MIVRPILENEKSQFNSVVEHPLQSWEWGEFKRKEGAKVERVGFFDGNHLVKAFQVFFHPLPKIPSTIGYFPKGQMPDEDQLSALRQLGLKHRAVAIKMEPNVAKPVANASGFAEVEKFLGENGCRPGRPLFTKYTFILDLKPTEEQLLANMKTKTRYNLNLAQRKGVIIVENSTKAGLDQHLEILKETTLRQGFYAHTPEYFQDMWEYLGNNGIMRILEARYQEKVLVSWIMFAYGETLYYPYGASTSEHRDLMASNLMMWEAIKLGKSLGMTKFDMWGALGPEPDQSDPWYGFHRFKQGYGGEHMEFLGTYDFVIDQPMYFLYQIAEKIRWKVLRFKTKLRRLMHRG